MSQATLPPFVSPVTTIPRQCRRWSAVRTLSLLCTGAAVVFVAGMIVLFAVQSVPVWRHSGISYLSGTQWHFPQRVFGALPMLYGTVVVAAVAVAVAAPLGIGTAVFMAELMPRAVRLPLKLMIELLAGIPSVVYGLLGILMLRNYVYGGLRAMGLDPLSGDSLLTAGLLLAIMILPTVVTLGDDALRGVPVAQRTAARGLGLTKIQMILSVSLPQAYRGLVAAVLLALGRALGETIAVFLVVGRQDNHLPPHWWSPEPLISAGQTITSKLGGAETNIAYGDPLHWAAVVGLGLLLMAVVAIITFIGGRLQQNQDRAPGGRLMRIRSAISKALRSFMCVTGLTVLGLLIRRPFDRLSVRGRFMTAAFVGATGLSTLIACGLLVGVVAAILFRGLPAVTWHFLTEQIALVGASGGIFYNLVGTLILILTAAAFTAPAAVGIALTQTVYLAGDRSRRALSLLLFTLNGVPSILFGILGLIVFVKFLGWGKSWLAGGILLGLMILPTVTVSLIERIKVIPAKYLEAARGLGLSRSQVVRSVVLPQSLGGLVTGLLLGLARAAGETAPIMFTATIFAGATLPDGVVNSPVLSLPYHIFVLAQDSFNPDVPAKVWGSATVLLALVCLLSLAALPVRLKVHEEARNV